MNWGKMAVVPIAAGIVLLAGCAATQIDDTAACEQALEVLDQARGSMELIQSGDSKQKVRVHLTSALERAEGLTKIEAGEELSAVLANLYDTYDTSIGTLLGALDGGKGDIQKAQGELMEAILDLDAVCPGAN